MIKDVTFKGQQLVIKHNGQQRETEIGITIYDVVFIDNYVIVLLSWEELANTDVYNRNILCLDKEGEQLWRVEDPDWYRSGKVKTEAPFTSIRIVDNKLEGGTWDGFDIIIDIKTGKLMKDWQFTK